MFKRELKINLKSSILWTFILCAIFLVVFLIYPSLTISDNMKMIDDLIKVFENIIKYMEENNLLQIKLDENIYYSFVDKNIIKNGEKITLTKNEVLFL